MNEETVTDTIINHPAIEQLRKIMQITDWTSFCPEKQRADALDKWIIRWLVEVEQSQLVVDSKYLSSENNDFVKYRMGQILGEVLTEECVTFTSSSRKITGHLLGVRRGK